MQGISENHPSTAEVVKFPSDLYTHLTDIQELAL